MDFMVGLTQTLGIFDSIWVILDRLDKSSYFILVKVKYNAEKLSKSIFVRKFYFTTSAFLLFWIRYLVHFKLLDFHAVRASTWLDIRTTFNY